MKFIGIDVHKRIYTACILDDNEKVVGELNDVPTTVEGIKKLTSEYVPEDCFIVFENLGRAHFVKRILDDMGYSLEVAHTGHGAMRSIADANFKTDSVDAYKLALVAKDMWSGRRFIRKAHLSDDANMRKKALCRMAAECAEIRDEMNLRIQEYVSLHDIRVPESYKNTATKRYRELMLAQHDPALTIMVNVMWEMLDQIKYADSELEKLYRDDEDAKILTSIKGVAIPTASYILTAIDGIDRFDTPEKLVSYFGLAVVHRESAGNVKKGHITKEGDPLVRKKIANVVVKHAIFCPDSELSKFYHRMKKTKAHWCAVTASARKLTCIIWAMLTNKQPYKFHPGE